MSLFIWADNGWLQPDFYAKPRWYWNPDEHYFASSYDDFTIQLFEKEKKVKSYRKKLIEKANSELTNIKGSLNLAKDSKDIDLLKFILKKRKGKLMDRGKI